MEQEGSISFSSVIACLLLWRRHVTSLEIVNFISKLNCEGMDINDIEDDVDDLFICVEINEYYSFSLKENFSYETVLYENVTVRKFLEGYVDKRVLEVMQRDPQYSLEKEVSNSKVIVKENTVSDSYFWRRKELAKKSTNFVKMKKPVKRNPWYSFLW